MSSTISVGGDGISAQNFGHTLKRIRWHNIMKVKKWRFKNPASGSFEDVFYVYDSDLLGYIEQLKNLGGPIAFTGKIVGLPLLLEQINARAREYHFPIFVLDQQAGGTRSKREVQVEAL